jgi:hypothetical protein
MSVPVRTYDAIHKAREITANSIHNPATEHPVHGEALMYGWIKEEW